MNFQNIADSFHAPTCIISVKREADGKYSDIRLVAGNAKYLEPIEHPVFPIGQGADNMKGIIPVENKFIPDSPYEKYLPKDMGFEDLIYRSAVLKMPVHTYVHLNNLDLWFDIFSMPLEYEDGDTCYCTYTTIQSALEQIGMSSSRSGTASDDVIKTCIKLHGTNDLKKTMEDVVREIRLICKAEVCTIMLIDQAAGTCSILANSIDDNSRIRRVTQFPQFAEVSMSWLDMIAGSDCIIIKDETDRDYVRRVNRLWYDNLEEAGVTSVVLFPLRYNNEILGFIWATNFDTANTMRIKETLELTTFFISAKLSGYRMLEHLKKISCTDQLTGLPNRRACTELISEMIKYNERFTVVSMDIDGFKNINDTMGLETGNKVLVEIASRWRSIADGNLSGTQDFIARMGGDEFALIISDYENDDEIFDTIRQYETVLGSRLTVDECDFYITASFGYSVYPDDARTSDSLFTYADAAMYEVKRLNSSNHILHFSPDILKAEQTLELKKKLINAIEEDTLFYHLQPQFDLSHRLRGFEALARMKDSDGNMISPGEFIPAAEKVGLVDKVDSIVFRKATMFTGRLIRETGADISLSVNVSVRHLMKKDFLDEVREIISESGIPADQLEIEITESIMIDSAEKAQRCIGELRKMGIKIAIDDFGTGYSSLSYLNNFPANLLKIDKSFIDRMNSGDSSKQYVAAIISIGHIMGFDVISEGVEDEKQLETLRQIGCDYIQGFIWGRPMQEQEAEKLIMDHVKNMKTL